MKKSYLLIILFAFFSNIIIAQQDSYKWKIGLHGGGMGYIGDLNTRLINPQTQWLADPMANLNPSFGLSLEYAPGANFGLRALWSRGQFTTNDRAVSFSNVLQTDAPDFARGLNARTNIQDLNLIGTFYLQRSRPTKKMGFAPYLMIGAGVTNFEVFGDLFFNNDNQYYYWSDFTVRSHAEGTPQPEEIESIILQDGDYETNLTNLRTESTVYQTTVGNIPIGLGFKWRLGDKLSLNFETLWHYTFTDYLDDVSGVYPIEFDVYPVGSDVSTALQSHAANPSGSQAIWRGREEDRFNDMYSFNSISLNYSFGYRKNARPIDAIAYGDDTRTIKEMTIITVDEKGDTLKIEQQVREDDAKETARLGELDEEKKEIDEEIALLEEQLREAGELPEVPEVEIEMEQPETPVVEVEQPETPEVEIEMEQPETPEAGGTVTESEVEIVAEGDRPARPARPDISLDGEQTEEVVIEIETPDMGVEVPDAEVEVKVPETRQSRRERRRNRENINKDIVIEVPEEPSVEIVVGDNVKIELPEEVEVEQPEMPEVEIEMEQPETPVVEVEVEQPETPEVEIEMEQPETPVVEVEIEQPEAPEVEIEAETPAVAIETETPQAEEAPKKPLTRRDIRRMRRNPPDINKDIEVDSESAKVSEEVMATVPQEPVEEVVEEVKTPNIPAAQVDEEIAIATPKTATQPASRPTREGALNPKISAPSATSFSTVDEARKAYGGFYVPFEDEAYYVTKELYTELDEIVRTMNRFPSLKVTLKGHTSDQEGISFVHQEITRKRVHYLQNYLVTKGIGLNRVRLSFFDDIANINEINKQQIDVIFE